MSKQNKKDKARNNKIKIIIRTKKDIDKLIIRREEIRSEYSKFLEEINEKNKNKNNNS